jgi:regulation of enolase protein 1 (concanavalin A-like superfamily)
MSVTDPIVLPGVDLAFRWATAPERWELTADGRVTIVAGPKTDLFADPGAPDGPPMLNTPRLLATPGRDGDFLLTARVTVDFAATYDAGVLLLWADERHWAKLCFEYSPAAEPMIVSVVTREASDDANAMVVDGETTWLRIARAGPAYAFHASNDGRRWQFIRHFRLDTPAAISIGFEAQSPTGSGCAAAFDNIRFEERRLADLRSGE